ncbi:MAG TPA: protein kinase [Pyrinomonadaceae bacterium]|jgi:serine/threonine-protein kinase|nr:protein kinase [Pyrinomonadaceae bacterium]
MAECNACGAHVSPNELFCGNCGTQQLSNSPELRTVAARLSEAVEVQPETPPVTEPPVVEPAAADPATAEPAVAESPSPELSATLEPAPISSESIRGSSTGNVHASDTGTPQRGTGGGRRAGVKQLDPGTILNHRYEIVRRIGGGGMGAVYLAKDRNLGDAPRAVKEMVESHLDPGQHEKAIGDFKRESLLLTSLEHPCIPTIYDYFYDEALCRFYLVMKYISGGDLASRMRAAVGGKIDEKTVTDWSMQVADVLDYLHSRPKPIIYRDLKPANLMIDGNNGRVMLIDFGIARWVSQQEKGVTAVGTMGYAPPELFSGRVQPASDVYSLGATMFHLLTGADPQDNPLLIFDFSKNPRPRQINPAISTEMEQILMRTVEYKPDDRYRTAGELRNELAIHLEKLMSGRVSYGVPAPILGGETAQMQTVYCGFCGGRIAADDVFCAHCGARQPLAAVGSSALLHTARPTAKLVVTGTTELDASFILQKESNLLGRTDPHSNIFPEIDLSRFDPETKVSRRHARIWLEGETFLVEDLGSVNGTVINDSVRLAPRQPRVLDSGDKLRVGETTLHFLVG